MTTPPGGKSGSNLSWSSLSLYEPVGPSPERCADRAFAAEHGRPTRTADRRSDDPAGYLGPSGRVNADGLHRRQVHHKSALADCHVGNAVSTTLNRRHEFIRAT
jgi:hypothetical protein